MQWSKSKQAIESKFEDSIKGRVSLFPTKPRFFLLYLLSFLIPAVVRAQSGIPSNSFEASYKKTNPTITYTYDSIRQIHNYSNNWDFDEDGKRDQVYFVGTGGAHLYYFLRVILSTDNRVRDFPFIQSDFPLLAEDIAMQQADFNPKTYRASFAVFDYENDNSKDIFIKLDNASFSTEKKRLTKMGVKTNLIIITFKNGKTIFEDFGG